MHSDSATPSVTAATSHAYDHYASSLHAYALEVTSQRVFNFSEQGFVHRLVSAKGDGKIVEIAPAPANANADFLSSCLPSNLASSSSGAASTTVELREWMDEEEELVWNRKLEGLAAEYSGLLHRELDKARSYYQVKPSFLTVLFFNPF